MSARMPSTAAVTCVRKRGETERPATSMHRVSAWSETDLSCLWPQGHGDHRCVVVVGPMLDVVGPPTVVDAPGGPVVEVGALVGVPTSTTSGSMR